VMDLGTEIDHVVVDNELSVSMIERVESEAERLGAKTLLIPECGCDVRTFYGDAPSILGRALRVPVRWVDTVLLESIQSGRLTLEHVHKRVTLHDPCQITRLSGMGALIRQLIAEVAPDFIEMTPNGPQNYCCNGSSGPMRLPENTELRRRVSALKAKQIEQTKAELVVSPCAVCTLTLNDICQVYGLAQKGQRKARMLYELVHEAVSQASTGTEAEQRLQSPACTRGQAGDKYATTLMSWFDDLRNRPDYGGLYAWLLRDPSVVQAVEESRRAGLVLEEMAPERRFSVMVGPYLEGESTCSG